MKDREKILRYFTATGEEAKDMAIRLLDLADAVDRGRPFAVGPFMSPFAAQVGQTIAAHAGTITAKSFGGYHEAERIKVAFVDGGYEGPVDFGIKLLSVKWDGRYRLIGHRDVLGSLMGLGIDRAVLGDILMQENGCQILCDADMAQWIIDNFHKVAMVTVTVEEVPMEELHPPEKTAKEVRATVASMPSELQALAFPGRRWSSSSTTRGQKSTGRWQKAPPRQSSRVTSSASEDAEELKSRKSPVKAAKAASGF